MADCNCTCTNCTCAYYYDQYVFFKTRLRLELPTIPEGFVIFKAELTFANISNNGIAKLNFNLMNDMAKAVNYDFYDPSNYTFYKQFNIGNTFDITDKVVELVANSVSVLDLVITGENSDYDFINSNKYIISNGIGHATLAPYLTITYSSIINKPTAFAKTIGGGTVNYSWNRNDTDVDTILCNIPSGLAPNVGVDPVLYAVPSGTTGNFTWSEIYNPNPDYVRYIANSKIERLIPNLLNAGQADIESLSYIYSYNAVCTLDSYLVFQGKSLKGIAGSNQYVYLSDDGISSGVTMNVPAGTTLTLSLYIYTAATATAVVFGNTVKNVNNGAPERVYLKYTTTTDNEKVVIRFTRPTGYSGTCTFYADGFQVEATESPTPWRAGGTSIPEYAYSVVDNSTKLVFGNMPTLPLNNGTTALSAGKIQYKWTDVPNKLGFKIKSVDTSTETSLPITNVAKNLLTANQSSFETDLTGITSSNEDILATQNSIMYYHGSKSLYISNGPYGGRVLIGPINVTAGSPITVSLYVLAGDYTNKFFINYYDDTNTYVTGSPEFTPSATWTRVSRTFTPTSPTIKLAITNSVSFAYLRMYIDAIQVEYGTTATEWELGGTLHEIFAPTEYLASNLIPNTQYYYDVWGYNRVTDSFIDKGDWNSATSYSENNRVNYQGKVYYAIQSNTNQDPALDTENTYWKAFGTRLSATTLPLPATPSSFTGEVLSAYAIKWSWTI